MSDRRGLVKRSVVGMFWTALSMGALAVAELVALVVLARLLSPDEFGVYAAALVIIKISAIFEGLGIAPAIVQRPTLEERHLRVGFTLSVLLSLSVAGLIWTTAPLVADLLRLDGLAPVVRAASVVFVFQGFSMVALAAAQRALRFRWLAGVDAWTFAVGFVVVGPALALLGFGTWALVAALVTQNFLRMVVLLAGQPHPKLPMLERRAIGELLYFGGGHTLARICNYLASQADKLVVGRWLGAEALGLYGLASQLMTAPAVLVGQILDRVLFPTMALVQEEPARLSRAYRSAVASCALLVLPASAVVTIVAPEFVLVLLGPGWEGCVVPLQILAVAMLFRTSSKLSDSVARATGVVYSRAWRQASFVVTVVVCALAGQNWGIEGVAVGAVLAVTANFLLMAELSLRVTGMRWSDFTTAHLPGLALAGAVGTVAWSLADWLRVLDVTPIVVVLDVILATAIVGLVLCWLLPALFLGQDGRSMLRIVATATPLRFQRTRPESQGGTV